MSIASQYYPHKEMPVPQCTILGGDVHAAKIKMKRDPRVKAAMDKIGSTNPDIGYDRAGNIVLKNPRTGAEINTDIPLSDF